jgi:hypothetical protein
MIWRGEAREAARLLCAAAIAIAGQRPVMPNPRRSAELDPSAPLDALPDLGVEWPDMDANDGTPRPAPRRLLRSGSCQTVLQSVPTRSRSKGVDQLGDAASCSKPFNTQSALQDDDSGDANAAQIDRRSRADAELLTELLRSRGYYDAGGRAADRGGGGAPRSCWRRARASNITSRRSSCPAFRRRVRSEALRAPSRSARATR